MKIFNQNCDYNIILILNLDLIVKKCNIKNNIVFIVKCFKVSKLKC